MTQEPMKNYVHYLDVFERNGFEKRKKMRRKPKSSTGQTTDHLAESTDHADLVLKMTYRPARFEAEWLTDYISGFYNEMQITDVLRNVKGGKEATVYCCRAHPNTGYELLAAKVYRPRKLRNLRNDALYREGRVTLDDAGKGIVRGRRPKVAMQKHTRFGQELRHTSWLGHEYGTMQLWYEAGVAVPKPLTSSDNVILMEYLGEEGEAAPPLHAVRLERDEAQVLFQRLLKDVELMLACGRIHADLSAFNVLYWDGAVKIIDFPQAVDPFVNPRAFDLLARDVTRLCEYFARYRIDAHGPSLAREMWERCIPTPELD